MKHVDVQAYFIRHSVETGQIHLEYCPTEDMVADIMTKALGKGKHDKFVVMMGLEFIEPNTTPSRERGNPN